MASLLFLQPLTNLSSSTALVFLRNPHHVPASTSLKPNPLTFKTLTTCFSLAESDSPKSLQPETRTVLQDLADSFDLPPDYFAKLPNDLRLDLNDAAFDLSNGKIIDECGQELGETLLNLSRAWEVADTSTSHSLASKIPDLEVSLTDNAKSGNNRLITWEAFGFCWKKVPVYGTIAKTMTAAGKLLSATPTSAMTDEEPKNESRMLKFGDLQLELTSEKATIGAIISFAFGILSWQLAQGVQNIPENSLQYANDNALLLAKSLRGALLAACYSSAVLYGFTTFGLILLGRQLKSSKEK
ncbi:hypothetical protein ACLB2K_064718 [Fragaria x ananassa]